VIVGGCFAGISAATKKASGELLTTEQVAERMKVTREHVSDLLRSGKLIGTKIGRDWVINSNDIPSDDERVKRGRPSKKTSAKSASKKVTNTPTTTKDDDEEDE
jgi:excisionase family DNA binding protein